MLLSDTLVCKLSVYMLGSRRLTSLLHRASVTSVKLELHVIPAPL